MIKKLIRLYLINVFALWVVSSYIDGFHLSEGFKSLFVVGAGFTALHLIIKPIITMILGPINLLTLGLIGLIVDGALLYLLTIYFPQISITSWTFSGYNLQGIILPVTYFNFWASTIVSAAIINVVRGVLSFLSSE